MPSLLKFNKICCHRKQNNARWYDFNLLFKNRNKYLKQFSGISSAYTSTSYTLCVLWYTTERLILNILQLTNSFKVPLINFQRDVCGHNLDTHVIITEPIFYKASTKRAAANILNANNNLKICRNSLGSPNKPLFVRGSGNS